MPWASVPLAPQHVGIDQHAGVLHVEQHARERPLEVVIELSQRRNRGEPGPERAVQLQREIRVLRGIGRALLERHVVERQSFRATAGHAVVSNRLDAEVQPRRRLEVVPRRRAVQYVRLEHRVEAHATQLDAVVAQDMRGNLEVVPDLAARVILE